ncbi:hypothetical protein D3C84_1289640 [compost metagenome]
MAKGIPDVVGNLWRDLFDGWEIMKLLENLELHCQAKRMSRDSRCLGNPFDLLLGKRVGTL